MGVTHSQLLLDQEPPASLQDRIAEEFEIIRPFPVASGRLSKSFLVQLDGGVKAVVKAIWVTEQQSNNNSNWLHDQVHHLQALKKEASSCIVPFVQWRYRNGVAYAIRPHISMVLADRLVRRPWFTPVEKLHLTHQVLHALAALHQAGFTHGGLTTHNIGVRADSSQIVLLDVGTFRDTLFPNNNPAVYHRWFTHCTSAPERFYTPPHTPDDNAVVTPAMDVFSAGCVVAEIFVGEAAAMEWGDWLALQQSQEDATTPEPFFLFKIENAAVRAAVKHMLGPQRWSDACRYIQRLPTLPACLLDVPESSYPDARLAAAVQAYPTVLRECLGMQNVEKQTYFTTLLSTPVETQTADEHDDKSPAPTVKEEEEEAFDKIQQLLQGLEIKDPENDNNKSASDYLVIYLQRILPPLRHAQRVSSKLVGLQLVHAVAAHTSDMIRVERIVPVLVTLLADVDAQVRAMAVTVLTSVVENVEQFAPSDAKLFPEYIFKRVGVLASDPSWLVRTAFSKCMAVLALVALKFLNVNHAVRLHEAVASARDSANTDAKPSSAFANVAADLLEPSSTADNSNNTKTNPVPSLLIPGHYQTEWNHLLEVVSRWVVQITTDASSSWPKRALLSECSRLCIFFGFDHIVTFLLPQLLTFFSVKELRADVFDHVPEICQSMGRAATEEYVLAIVEVGLVDETQAVVAACLRCLSRLVQCGLVVAMSRRWDMYGALLVHPARAIREQALQVFAHLSRAAGSPNDKVYMVPMLLPFLRFPPTNSSLLGTVDGLRRMVKPAWDRTKWDSYLRELITAERNRSVGTWTSIGIVSESGGGTNNSHDTPHDIKQETIPLSGEQEEERSVRSYLRLVARHTSRADSSADKSLAHGMEGSLKLAQSVMFPRQNGRSRKTWLPTGYAPSHASAATSIRSVSALGEVYGLSIIGPNEGITKLSQKTETNPPKPSSGDAAMMSAFFSGEWLAEAKVEPDVVDTCMLVTKLKGLKVPPLSVRLGDPTVLGNREGSSSSADLRPRVKGLFATSTTATGHTAPVMRLAVSIDQRFFVSGSHDGTCRVWEIPSQPEQMAGLLRSKATFSGHINENTAKVNDVAMLEGTHSVVSGDSMGGVHVWRVDLQSSSAPTNPVQGRFDAIKQTERTRIVGTCSVHNSNSGEGEVLAVSHFNTSSACIVTYATQKGNIHTWDLRASNEPFKLRHSPEIGYLTSMALGGDRHWIVTGTRQGFLALWDIRYQQCVKLWRHSRGTSISRLATSMVSPPQTWGTQGSLANSRPFVFAAAGSNECAMFDVLTGTCCECFRTVDGGGRIDHSSVQEPPTLTPVPIASKRKSDILKPARLASDTKFLPTLGSLNCMVGSIAPGQNSYLVTGGSDGRIRLWDFLTPSKCHVVSGQPPLQPRPSFERIDFEGQRRLILCRESHSYKGQQHFHGVQKPDHSHTDSIQDLKVIDNSLLSCSRDCTVKVWR